MEIESITIKTIAVNTKKGLAGFLPSKVFLLSGTKPEHPKVFPLRVRVDKITLEKLDCCVKKSNSNCSDVVKRGII